MAQKHFDGGKAPKAKKVLIHTLRMILMAAQICDQGQVSDWNCASDYFDQLTNSYHLSTWSALKEEFDILVNTEMERMRAAYVRRTALE